MSNQIDATTRTKVENNVVLISKIYESFEALEETLGMLKLEEPLFITYVAKKPLPMRFLRISRKIPKPN